MQQPVEDDEYRSMATVDHKTGASTGSVLLFVTEMEIELIDQIITSNTQFYPDNAPFFLVTCVQKIA